MNLTKMIFDNAKHYFSDVLEKFNLSDFRIYKQECENVIGVFFLGISVDIACTYSNIHGISDDTSLLIAVRYLDNGFEKFVGITLHQGDLV